MGVRRAATGRSRSPREGTKHAGTPHVGSKDPARGRRESGRTTKRWQAGRAAPQPRDIRAPTIICARPQPLNALKESTKEIIRVQKHGSKF